MRNAGLDETQAGIKIAGRNISNLRYTDDTTLMEENEEELKSFLTKVKKESEKVGFKLNIQKTNMASGPFTSWQIDGETEETVADFILEAPEPLQMVTAAMKLKDATPWEKSYDQLRQHIKKQRHYFAKKGPSSQRYGFSSGQLWMWELDYKESWMLKNWCFWIVVLEDSWESLGLQGDPTNQS